MFWLKFIFCLNFFQTGLFVIFLCFIFYYFMIDTFSFVIQQPLFNLQLKVRGGLDNVAGRAGLMNEFMNNNEGFICINPSSQGFIQIIARAFICIIY